MKPARLIAIMCVAEVLSMSGFGTFAALLPDFITEWNLSNTDAGWINAIFFAGYLISVAVLVSLTDRVDPKRIYLWCMALTFASLIGFSFLAQGFWSAIILRCLAGIGLAGTYMPGLKALSDLIDGPAQSRAVSFYTSSFGIGTSLSFYLSGKITLWLNWQWAFGLAAAGPLLAWLMVWWVLPANAPDPPKEENGSTMQNFKTVLTNSQAMGYTLAYTFHNFELFGLRSWLVAFLVFSQGLQPEGSWLGPAPATLAALVILLALPASVSGNELAVRFGRRRVVVAIMSASAAMAWVLGFSAAQPFWWIILLSLVYGLLVTADSSAITAGTVAAAPPGLRGTTMAVHSCVGFTGSFLGPLMFGVVLDMTGRGESVFSWGMAFGTMGVAVAMGPVSLLLLGRSASLRQARSQAQPPA